jgi:hypothetical protein
VDLAVERRGGGEPGARIRRVSGGRPDHHPRYCARRPPQRAGSDRAVRGRRGDGPPVRQGAKVPRAVRGDHSPPHVQGERAGGASLPSPARGGAAAGGPSVARRRRRRFRHRGGRLRAGPHGARLRRRRLRRGAGARARPGAAGRRRRHLRRHDLARDRGQAGHGAGDQRPHHPAAQAGRPLASVPAVHAHVPPLLALPEPAHLLRP